MQSPNKTPVEIVAILDRSGSMASLCQEAIGGFNSFLSEQQALEGEANMTVVLFDYEIITHPAKPVKDVEPLDTTTFVPRGTTALNDAIGSSLATLEAKQPDKAIILIITDGAENASREYSAAQVKEKVETAKAKGWEVVFLAANIDAFATGANYGIAANSTVSFTADSFGVHDAFAAMGSVTRSYRA